MILREKTKKELLDVLDASILGKYAFKIQFPEDLADNSNLKNSFVAAFIGDTNYYYRITQKYDPDKKTNGYNLTYAPGIYLKEPEAIFVVEFPDTIKHFKLWVTRLIDDLKDKSPLINNVYEEIHRIEEEFEQKINEKFESTENGYFNQEEIITLREKIDSLYSKFDKLKEEQEIKDAELRTIKAELEKLKNTLPILPKSAWYKSSGKKIINIIGKYLNPDMVKSISTEVVKGLLN